MINHLVLAKRIDELETRVAELEGQVRLSCFDCDWFKRHGEKFPDKTCRIHASSWHGAEREEVDSDPDANPCPGNCPGAECLCSCHEDSSHGSGSEGGK